MKARSLATLLMTFCLIFEVQGALAQAGASSSGAKKTTLIMNFAIYGRHSPYFVALDKGYYKDAGFDMQILPSQGSSFAVSAVESGQADYGMIEAGTLVQNIAKGAKVKAFAAFLDATLDGLASLKPFDSPKALLGARIAAAAADSARVEVPIVMELNGLDPSNIQWQTAANQTYYQLLLGGETDLTSAAFDQTMPALEKLLTPLGKSAYFFSFAKWGYDGLGYLLVASNQRLTQSPDEVKAFMAATTKGVEYAIEHPEEAASATVKYNPTLDPKTTLTQWKMTSQALQSPYEKEHGFGVITKDRVQRTIDLTKKGFKLSESVTVDQVFADGFVTAKR
jgi:NitT/TauT family transport system substrate-binding protein